MCLKLCCFVVHTIQKPTEMIFFYPLRLLFFCSTFSRFNFETRNTPRIFSCILHMFGSVRFHLFFSFFCRQNNNFVDDWMVHTFSKMLVATGRACTFHFCCCIFVDVRFDAYYEKCGCKTISKTMIATTLTTLHRPSTSSLCGVWACRFNVLWFKYFLVNRKIIVN